MNGIRRVRGDFKYRNFDFNKIGQRSMPVIARVGLQRWVSSFQKGGYATDASRSGWRPRKSNRSTKPLLIDTMRLFRSVRTKRVNARRVVWGSNTPYAGYHNDGDSNMPQREFMGDSRELFKDIDRIISKNISKLL